MSISEEKREELLDEWRNLTLKKEKKIELGQNIFRKLFQVYPHFIKLFKRFDGMIDLEEIINSSAMKAHGLRFVNSLSGVFESLDNAEELGDMLRHVGSSHKLRNVTVDHFKATVPILEEVLLDFLITDSVKDTIQKILAVATPIIAQGNLESTSAI